VKHQKKRLVKICGKVLEKRPISPEEIDYLLSFEKLEKENPILKTLKILALPLSLFLGFLFTIYPEEFENFSSSLPPWTNFSDQYLLGVDYLWDILGDPVAKANILYHIPNIVLYAFGVLGVKKLFELIDKKTWLDKVLEAKTILTERLSDGTVNFRMKRGHSLLFVGLGDFIGMQQTLNCKVDETVTISSKKPNYTKIWNFYDVDTLYEDLKEVVIRADGESCGEYVFFPVKDDQIFLPGEKSYDLSPHKLDLLVQNIRVLEKELRWKPKKIIIIGDKFHKSYVRSEDQKKVVKKSEDVISLQSIVNKYPNMSLIDPTDVVLKKIIGITDGRKIVFRATKEGIKEYKQRFYQRLKQQGYKYNPKKKGVLTIGYDLYEDQTEQQTLARKVDDYYPVVLSKNVRDALVKNGYKESEFLYVPDLVLEAVIKMSAQQ
jgi:hypothetical protein